MPSPALSPQQNPNTVAMPTSSRQSLDSSTARPPAMKRHSSQSSHGGSRQVLSPGSAGEHHPLRHAIGARQRHAKLVLPRNHSSGRNLAKMGKQAAAAGAGHHVQHADEGKRPTPRRRSHEGDSEIRLPGSLEEEGKPMLRRNVTSHELPKERAATKLKKNLSHGQLSRLSSGKNLVSLAMQQKAPPSPGLKGRKGRARSEELVVREQDLHEQEVGLQRKQQERKVSQLGGAPRKVGFAVESVGDDSDEAETPLMEGSGLQDDEWTEDSASASPLSTRLNTANNSRRPSVAVDKPPDEEEEAKPQHPNISFHMTEVKQPKQPEKQVQLTAPEADGTPAQSDEDEEVVDMDEGEEEKDTPSPKSATIAPAVTHDEDPTLALVDTEEQPPPPHIRSPLHAAKDYPDPVAKRLTSAQLPAPALLSSVSALDDNHSARGSPAPSLRSTRSITGHDGAVDQDDKGQDFVSRFLPSTSHPLTSSGTTTAINTPKMGSFQNQTPEEESTLERAKTGATFQTGPVSPGSTRSASSGATTPAIGRSRIELKMLQDKALADREAAAERQPLVPHHFYDRRNESLKSYLNLMALNRNSSNLNAASDLPLGPEIFQGRFKAVNMELKVVQQFRDPTAEAVKRLQRSRGSKLYHKRGSPLKLATQLKGSKSAITLPSRTRPSAVAAVVGGPGNAAISASASTATLPIGTEERRAPRRGVSFAGVEPQASRYEGVAEGEDGDQKMGPDAIARMLWDSVGR
ncbi:hypothetical protein LTR57_011098 [Friedmanniomyces endolithicus]|nr:hypothetical protein LTR57_011098 [Friedmanniomyces endolithicus]